MAEALKLLNELRFFYPVFLQYFKYIASYIGRLHGERIYNYTVKNEVCIPYQMV